MADEYTLEMEDLGSLGEYLGALEKGAERALLDSPDDTLLYVLGTLDHLVVGDLTELSDAGRRELAGELASVQAGATSDAHQRGFRSIDVRGEISPEEREVADRLRGLIQTELGERWGGVPPGLR